MSSRAEGQEGGGTGRQGRRAGRSSVGRGGAAGLLALLLMLAPAMAAAHPGHDHTVMGTVKSIQNGHLEVEAKDGKISTFMLAETTKILRGKVKATAAEIKVGERVVAIGAAPPKAARADDRAHDGGHPAGMMIAKEVRLAAK